MFTGLVETTGIVARAEGDSPRRLVVTSSLPKDEIQIGDSIAIDGCCLTVVAHEPQGLAFEAATETLARTTIGRLAVGRKVHLERALRLSDRLGGHLVLGHVDGVGAVAEVEQKGSALYLGIDAPEALARFIASQGSITVAGVSLTVTSVQGRRFFVGLIPHTVVVTTLGALRLGDPVNLEVDVMARYVERLLSQRGASLTGKNPNDKEVL